jgi:transposase InsO family protein
VIYRTDEDALTRGIVTLASEYGRYGYRRIAALLRDRGWRVGKDRAQRIWRREVLKVPQKQRTRRRPWLNDGWCLRLRPETRDYTLRRGKWQNCKKYVRPTITCAYRASCDGVICIAKHPIPISRPQKVLTVL